MGGEDDLLSNSDGEVSPMVEGGGGGPLLSSYKSIMPTRHASMEYLEGNSNLSSINEEEEDMVFFNMNPTFDPSFVQQNTFSKKISKNLQKMHMSASSRALRRKQDTEDRIGGGRKKAKEEEEEATLSKLTPASRSALKRRTRRKFAKIGRNVSEITPSMMIKEMSTYEQRRNENNSTEPSYAQVLI